MGGTATEIASAFALMEDLNRAARANAKVVFHVIVQLPHDVTPEQRLAALRAWCEAEFTARDLPFVAAVHVPSANGDQRNFHAHVSFSFRPMVWVAPFTWDAGRELRAELDNPAAFRLMREDFATVMTAVCQLAGKDRTYTGLSNAERGLKHKPLEKLGPAKTRLARSGEHVPADARNRRLIARNEAIADADQLKRRQRRLERQLADIRTAASRVVQAPAPRTQSHAGESAAIGGITRVRSRGDVQRPAREVVRTPARQHVSASTNIPVVRASAATPTNPPFEPSHIVQLTPRSDETPPAMTIRKLRTFLLPHDDGAVAGAPTSKGGSSVAQLRSADAPPVVKPTRTVATANMTVPVHVRSLNSSPRVPDKVASPEVPVAAARRTADQQADGHAVTASSNALHARRRLDAASGVRAIDRATSQDHHRNEDQSITVVRSTDHRPYSSTSRRPVSTVLVAMRAPADVPFTNPALGLKPNGQAAAARKARLRARQAEAQRALDAEAASAAEAARQATAAEEAERLTLDALRERDPLVQEFVRAGLSVADEVLVALGRDHAWERSVPVQHVLAGMLDDQNERIARLDDAPDGTPPVAIVAWRVVPAAHLAPDLKRSVERWSDDRSFRALVAHLWPTSPPASSSEREVPTAEPALAYERMRVHETGDAVPPLPSDPDTLGRSATARHGLAIAPKPKPASPVTPEATPTITKSDRRWGDPNAGSSPTPAAAALPDGFGGIRTTPAPLYDYYDMGGARVAPYDHKIGKPTNQLLMLAKFAGDNPLLIDHASDGQLMALRGAPPLMVSLLAMWRGDEAIDALITRIVTDSRAAGKPTWPPEIATELRTRRAVSPRRPPPDLFLEPGG